MLLTEASAAVAFSHRNAVRFIDIGQYDGQLALVMELVRGQPFSSLLDRTNADRRPLPPDIILHIGAQVARALATAHMTAWCEDEEKGMIHAEVSPQSIIIGYDGAVKLLGVGVGRSRLILPPARARLPYRAPELFERKRPDTTTDVYGLGATLYEAFARTRNYHRDTVSETIQAILEAHRPSLASVAVLDPELAEIIDDMMERVPEKRPGSMHEIANMFETRSGQSGVEPRAWLADEMRLLFAGEMQESVFEPSTTERPPIRPTFTPAALDPFAPLEPSVSAPMPIIMGPNFGNPPTPPAPPSSTGSLVDELDVDSLVDVIVSASARARMPPQAPPKLEAPTIPERAGLSADSSGPPRSGSKPTMARSGSTSGTSPPQSRTPPKDTAYSRTPKELPRVSRTPPKDKETRVDFSRALDKANSQNDIDALVDVIVHASARTIAEKNPTPIPHPLDVTPPVVKNTGDVVGGETFGYRTGEVIGERYRIIEKLGQGGMAVVYKVMHTLLEKSLALKLLRPELSTVPYVVQRFQREARFVSQLDDPRIVRVTDFGRAENGSLFLVMELIDGESLSRRLERSGVPSLQMSLHIAEQVLLALDHAHRQNVIHRDLKPDNIMLVEKNGSMQVKIVDFGIAKLASETPMASKPLTQAGMVFGSPRYMSPEQAAGEIVDLRSDLYAVGVMLYEMLVGKRPFDGSSARAILSAVLMQPPAPLDLKLDDPARASAIERIVLKALAKDKDERYPSAMAFWEALRSTM